MTLLDRGGLDPATQTFMAMDAVAALCDGSGPALQCHHDGTQLEAMPDDPLLPSRIEPLECPECGEVYHHDTDTGEVVIDA